MTAYLTSEIADPTTYLGQIQPIAGTQNSLTPPRIVSSLYDNQQIDGAGKFRVSQPQLIFDGKFRFDLLPLQFDQTVVGTGAVTYIANESCARLSVAANGDSALMRGHFQALYRSGQSLFIPITSVLTTPVAGVTKQVGMYSSNDGVMFRNISSGPRFVIRTSTSGAPVDTEILQSNWNVDTFNGSGGSSNPSEITLDMSKIQNLVIDLKWQGAGRVRFGFDFGGQIYYAHYFNTANVLNKVYMKTACLSISAEIFSTAAVAASMDFICSAIVMEGSPNGSFYTAATSTQSVAATGQAVPNSLNTNTMLCMRTRSTHLDASIMMLTYHALNFTNIPFYIEAAIFRGFSRLSATLNPWTNFGTASEFSTVSTALAPGLIGTGTVIDTTFIGGSGGGTETLSTESIFNGLLSATGDDLIVIRARGLGGAYTAHFSAHIAEHY